MERRSRNALGQSAMHVRMRRGPARGASVSSGRQPAAAAHEIRDRAWAEHPLAPARRTSPGPPRAVSIGYAAALRVRAASKAYAAAKLAGRRAGPSAPAAPVPRLLPPRHTAMGPGRARGERRAPHARLRIVTPPAQKHLVRQEQRRPPTARAAALPIGPRADPPQHPPTPRRGARAAPATLSVAHSLKVAPIAHAMSSIGVVDSCMW